MRKFVKIKALMPAIVGAALTLSACGKEAPQASPSQEADQLDQAAAQSDPTAAAVIRDRADELRNQASTAPAGEPGSYTQETMRKAGEAAAPSDAPAN